MLNLLPPRCYTDGAEYQALEGMEGNDLMFSKHHITVLAESFALPNITLDGTSLTSAFVPFPEVTGWFYAQVPVNAGDVDLLCPAGCQTWATGFGDYDGYTFHLPFIDKEQYLSVGENAPLRISVFPNPAENQFSVVVPSGQWTGDLYTLGGRHLQARVLAGTSVWDTSALPAGVYLLKVSGEGTHRTVRVAVQ